MAKRDYYNILGISKNASDKEIKQAYRRMAMKYHPDRNKNDDNAEAAFKEVSEAFEVLSNGQKKQAYDQFGHDGLNMGSGGGGGHGGAGFDDLSDMFGDIFGDIFNGGGGGARHKQSQSHRGSDLQYNLELELTEILSTVTKNITIPSYNPCNDCKGSGAEKGSKPIACSTCQGHGQIRVQQGFFTIQKPCHHCQGSGTVIQKPCKPCRGQGRTQSQKTLSVKIPAGVDSDDRIRLSGEGEAGRLGGTSGDLYVLIKIKKHPIFKRDGSNLYCEIPISFVEAALGNEIEVPTLNGRLKLKIPPETQTGSLFRLKGKGLSSPQNHHASGDLLCQVIVEIPVKLSDQQTQLLHDFQKTLKGNTKHTPQKESFYSRIKKNF
ncbi:MAG: molecular chaperone DnaJ [Endozoicomonadaceae bacterium]|nr:molecular chaperone DnaJ [Endozoicomonadaceae bacterium]MBE8232975.1 molecular chaperone DnaJ [Endozoicomonadaceae bacterium]